MHDLPARPADDVSKTQYTKRHLGWNIAAGHLSAITASDNTNFQSLFDSGTERIVHHPCPSVVRSSVSRKQGESNDIRNG
jgi:hypothetical protein